MTSDHKIIKLEINTNIYIPKYLNIKIHTLKLHIKNKSQGILDYILKWKIIKSQCIKIDKMY